MAVRVVNLRNASYDVYIGRAGRGQSSSWGNPFVIGQHGTRAQVIELFKQQLWQRIKSGQISLEELAALDGKTLGCFCKPAACHGDVIAAAVEWAIKQLEASNAAR